MLTKSNSQLSKKIIRAVLDRIDLTVSVSRVPHEKLLNNKMSTKSQQETFYLRYIKPTPFRETDISVVINTTMTFQVVTLIKLHQSQNLQKPS